MVESLSLFASAAAAIIKVLLISIVGAAAAIYPTEQPVMDKKAQRGISRMLTHVVMPASIVFGLGSNISSNTVGKLAVVMLWSIINTTLSFTVSFFAFRAIDLPNGLGLTLTAATTFHNSVSMPLLIGTSLCDAPQLSHIDDCKQQALAICYVYLLPWQVLFWTVGFTIFSARGCEYELESEAIRRAELQAAGSSGSPSKLALGASYEKRKAGLEYAKVGTTSEGPELCNSIAISRAASSPSWREMAHKACCSPCMVCASSDLSRRPHPLVYRSRFQ
jgi:predicted permease